MSWFLLMVLAVVVIALIKGGSTPPPAPHPMPHGRPFRLPSMRLRHLPHGAMTDVTALTLAVDARARKFVQAECERIAGMGHAETAEGPAQMLRETVVLLKRTEASWLYAGALNMRPTMLAAQAETVFDRAVAEAHSRAAQENMSGEAADPGLAVVTLVVEAHRELMDVRNPTNAVEMKRALEGILTLRSDQLVALELVWAPASIEGGISAGALERLYPELKKIDERTVAGRVFCRFCGGPYAGDLGACPHCGAGAAEPRKR